MKQDKNEKLKEELEKDIQNSRGALREILDHNRIINAHLVEEMVSGDFARIEEYNMITEGILKSVKLLAEINAAQPKTIKDIDTIKGEKKKINLDDLIED